MFGKLKNFEKAWISVETGLSCSRSGRAKMNDRIAKLAACLLMFFLISNVVSVSWDFVYSQNFLDKSRALSDDVGSSLVADNLDKAVPGDGGDYADKEWQRTEDLSRESDNLVTNNFSNANEWNQVSFDNEETELIVGFKEESFPDIPKLRAFVETHNGALVNTVTIGGEVAAVIRQPMSQVASITQELKASPLVAYIEPNMKVRAFSVPNDPHWGSQWGPQKIAADWAWNTTLGSKSVLVAVLDTGIYYNHPDIAPNYVSLGYDWINNDADPIDDFGHGTHCAGIIAASINNSMGIAGLAQVRIMAEKVLDSWGYGTWESISNGIIHATDVGADIISMSLGGNSASQLMLDAVKYAYDAGVLLVASAGNDASTLETYPAGYNEVVAVVATDQYDNKASFSNYGDWSELAAPGVQILSTVFAGLELWSGTSMACPHVVGVAALVLSLYPNMTGDWVRAWLRYTADDLGDPGFDNVYGFGRTNARRAVESTIPIHDVMVVDLAVPPYGDPNQLLTIVGKILNFGAENETDLVVQLLINGTRTEEKSVPFLESGKTISVMFGWQPPGAGKCNLTFCVVPVSGELEHYNNALFSEIPLGTPVKAIVVHSSGNVLSQAIANWITLTNNWELFGDTMVFVDYTTLNKEVISYADLVASGANVLIVSGAYDPNMGWEFTDSEIDAIERYVQEGHGLLVTGGTLGYLVPNNNKLGRLLGIDTGVVWRMTHTDLLEVLDTTHPLLKGLTNPLVFPQVQTAVPDDDHWDPEDMRGGQLTALGHFEESAIVIRRGLVYLSPWFETIPSYYHHHLQLLYNAVVWSNYENPEHDLVVSLRAPRRLLPGVSASTNAIIANEGTEGETDVWLGLFINASLVSSTVIPRLPSGGSFNLTHDWHPEFEGFYNVTAFAVPVSGEDSATNNVAFDMIPVLKVAAERVLVYTDDFVELPPFRHPIVALTNLRIDFTHYDEDALGFSRALSACPWDLVIVDHVKSYTLGSFWDGLENYVKNGGTLIISTTDVDGSNSEPTTLWETLGASWAFDMPYAEPVFPWICNHSVFTFPNSVGNLTTFVEGYLDNGDHMEATTGTSLAGFSPVPTVRSSCIILGNPDRSLLFSFALCEFRHDQDFDGKIDAVELWENAIIFMSGMMDHDTSIFLEAPTFCPIGNAVVLNATVSNLGLSPESILEVRFLVNETLLCSVLAPDLRPLETCVLSCVWSQDTEGMYALEACVEAVDGEIRLQNNVNVKIVRAGLVKFVLFDQSHLDDDIAYYSIWTEVLSADGFAVETHRYGSITSAILAKYSVFVVPQAFLPFSAEELLAVKDYVIDGGGLLVIGDHSQPIYNNLTGYAGIVWRPGGTSGVTSDISQHPVTAGIKTVRIESPTAIFELYGNAHGLIRDPDHHIVVAESEQPFGKIIGFADETSLRNDFVTKADNIRLAVNMIEWLSVPILYPHELAVWLEAPTCVERQQPCRLNITVRNLGVNIETGIQLQVFIDGIVLQSCVIAQVQVHSSYETSMLWTPSGESLVHNVTVYIESLYEETYFDNNKASLDIRVSSYDRIHIAREWTGAGLPMNWHGDDRCWRLTMPFDFPFYNEYYHDMYVSSNGLISFGVPETGFANSLDSLALKNVIAVAWDDWKTMISPCDIYVWQDATHVGVRWDVQLFGTGFDAEFEVIIEIDGTIKLNYGNCSGSVSATLGISDSHGDVLAEDVIGVDFIGSIMFVPRIPRHDVALVGVEPSSCEAYVGSTLNFSVSVENQADAIENFTVTAWAIPVNSSSSFSSEYQPQAQGATRIYLSPSEYVFSLPETSVGDRFNVTVLVEMANDLATWQVCLRFNSTLLTATRWFVPEWDSEYVFFGSTEIVPPPFFEPNAVTGGATIVNSGSFFGDGKLCVVEFQIAAIPPTGVLYSSVLNINSSDTFLLDPSIYTIAADIQDGTYKISCPAIQPGYFLGAATVVNLSPKETVTIIFSCSTAGIPAGMYLYDISIAPLLYEFDIADNELTTGNITLRDVASVVHDVSIFDVNAPSAYICEGWNLSIHVNVTNLGQYAETFAVIMYCNETEIAHQLVVNLPQESTKTLLVIWNTANLTAGDSFFLRAVADTVPYEIDTSNNALTSAYIRVRLLGDIDGDEKVDDVDLHLACEAFGTFPSSINWNLFADLDQNGKVNIRDIAGVCRNYGRIIT